VNVDDDIVPLTAQSIFQRPQSAPPGIRIEFVHVREAGIIPNEFRVFFSYDKINLRRGELFLEHAEQRRSQNNIADGT
jgi:hypothetical protein